MTKKTLAAGIVVILVAVGAYVLISGSGDSDTSGEEVDVAFAAQMVPHHEAAIKMAELAKENGEHPEIIQMANNIVETQSAEIETLNSIHDRMATESSSNTDNGSMDMSDSMMGMDMDMSELENANPFDREFIDQMIPHHQGAIRMAYAELEEGQDQETKDLAQAIIDAQAKEIAQMNRWRMDWYGAPSPSGGAPSGPMMGDSMDSDEMNSMDHMDHYVPLLVPEAQGPRPCHCPSAVDRLADSGREEKYDHGGATRLGRVADASVQPPSLGARDPGRTHDREHASNEEVESQAEDVVCRIDAQ